jgi:hypothetical protein
MGERMGRGWVHWVGSDPGAGDQMQREKNDLDKRTGRHVGKAPHAGRS